MNTIGLNPVAFRLEAWKITYPKDNRGGRKVFKMEPMRFVPHPGIARGGSMNREHNAQSEFNDRRNESTLGSETFLAALHNLIEREAMRAGVNPWFAQVCLVNGVDPLVQKRAL